MPPKGQPAALGATKKRVTFGFSNTHKQPIMVGFDDKYIDIQQSFGAAMNVDWQTHRFMFVKTDGTTHEWDYHKFIDGEEVKVTAIQQQSSQSVQAEGTGTTPRDQLEFYDPSRTFPVVAQMHWDGSVLVEREKADLFVSTAAARQFQSRIGTLKDEVRTRKTTGPLEGLKPVNRERELRRRDKLAPWLKEMNTPEDTIINSWGVYPKSWLPEFMWPRLKIYGSRAVEGGQDIGKLDPEDWEQNLIISLACYAMATPGVWRKAVWRLVAIWTARRDKEGRKGNPVVKEILDTDVKEAIRSLARPDDYKDPGEIFMPPPSETLPNRPLTDAEAADELIRMAAFSKQ